MTFEYRLNKMCGDNSPHRWESQKYPSKWGNGEIDPRLVVPRVDHYPWRREPLSKYLHRPVVRERLPLSNNNCNHLFCYQGKRRQTQYCTRWGVRRAPERAIMIDLFSVVTTYLYCLSVTLLLMLCGLYMTFSYLSSHLRCS